MAAGKCPVYPTLVNTLFTPYSVRPLPGTGIPSGDMLGNLFSTYFIQSPQAGYYICTIHVLIVPSLTGHTHLLVVLDTEASNPTIVGCV